MEETIRELIMPVMDATDIKNFSVNNIIKATSFKLYNQLIIKVYTEMMNIYRIQLTESKGLNLFKLIPSKYKCKEKNRVIQIDIEKNEEALTACLRNIGELLQIKTRYIIDNYGMTYVFGCCSKYMECSDAKRCIYPDKKFAKGCQYKENLESGKIFYGNNKNI